MNNIPSTNLQLQNLRTSLIWAVLVLSTLGGWLGVEHKLHLTNITLVTVMGLAALKAALVIMFYMEVAQAPLWLKGICVAWLGSVSGMVWLCYLQPGLVVSIFV